MHAAFILLDECRYQGLELKPEDFDEFVYMIDSVEQDDKQSNTKTWNYHLNVVIKFISFLENKGFSFETEILSLSWFSTSLSSTVEGEILFGPIHAVRLPGELPIPKLFLVGEELPPPVEEIEPMVVVNEDTFWGQYVNSLNHQNWNPEAIKVGSQSG